MADKNIGKLISLGILTLVSLLSGCQDPERNRAAQQHSFIYCGQGTPDSFNPQLAKNGIAVDTLSAQLYDRLVVLDQGTHQPQPALAKHWDISADGLRYRFTLRPDVKFHQTPWFTPTRRLNASDVVFSFNRIIDPNHPYHNIGGGQYPWFESLNLSELIDHVEAVDDMTVEFTLSKPNNAFLSNLATSFSVILSQEYAQKLMQQGRPGDIDTLPVGTGPYQLSHYAQGDYIRLQQHLGYWQGPAKMQQVILDISDRGTGAIAKLLSGECDVLASPVASQLATLAAHPEINVQRQEGMNLSYLALNTQHPALQSSKVRQAIAYAINRNHLLNSVYYGTGSAATGVLANNSWAYRPSHGVSYQPEKAKKLLQEAGVKDLNLELWYSSQPRPYNPSPRKTAELIQADLAEVGIHVSLHALPLEDLSRSQQHAPHDMTLMGWVADNADPDSMLRPFLSCQAQKVGLNYANWCNADYDALIDDALETRSIPLRIDRYLQAQKLLKQQLPIIPLAHSVQIRAHNNSIHGLVLSPFENLPFTSVFRQTAESHN
ncbi:Peptide transport periplasmic protein SapA [Vibrio stylophorae]|uniref:Peptide transport periplasmic protein SapA n=1 Tax=Vibrio stylophorae TaxID=659351 RepID=A0ABN8DRK0_9VIBR|nr:ABC transporter substrate-binding protein SapA [Vibrio stylophorae]CAH0533776.1 Peptide transport periplasmic protein SapA [Vibrio stylophorae]